MEAEEKDLALQSGADEDLPVSELDESAATDDEKVEDSGPQTEWFVIHSYSGMENKVKKNTNTVESMGMSDKFCVVADGDRD